ncbi:MAG: putative sugar nucleotidyl transferase, partial [Rhabdochlamydiaceae bacterium]
MNLGEIRLVVFDDPSLRKNFYPLSLTRPTFDLTFGTGTLLTGIEQKMGSRVADLFVPGYLEEISRETHPSYSINKD